MAIARLKQKLAKFPIRHAAITEIQEDLMILHFSLIPSLLRYGWALKAGIDIQEAEFSVESDLSPFGDDFCWKRRGHTPNILTICLNLLFFQFK